MRISYDASVDAAYIYFVPSIAPGAVKRTYPCDPEEVGAEINLDFDEDGRILGVEVLAASRHLPLSLLSEGVEA